MNLLNVVKGILKSVVLLILCYLNKDGSYIALMMEGEDTINPEKKLPVWGSVETKTNPNAKYFGSQSYQAHQASIITAREQYKVGRTAAQKN